MHALFDLEIRGLFSVDYTNTLRIQLPRYSEKNPTAIVSDMEPLSTL